MSCGSFRTVLNNSSVALDVFCGTERLHFADVRDLVRWQALIGLATLVCQCACSVSEPDAVMLCISYHFAVCAWLVAMGNVTILLFR
jgi:hypothetical protein